MLVSTTKIIAKGITERKPSEKIAVDVIENFLLSFNAMMKQEGVAPEMRRMIIDNLSK